MIRNVALLLILLVPSISQAQLDSEFKFHGQNAETLNVEKKVTVIIPEIVERPSTCTREVPIGEREVCRDVTRYRQECSWIPSSERCWTENDQVCRSVTRYRQECSSGPSRQVCTQRPTRRVCTERPTRTVCTTRPDGREHCNTVGGGQHCTDVGGGNDCRTVPGERVCRQVAYTDRDCDNVPRRRCETIPGRNDCRNTPYQAEECETETQYETEVYACTRLETINRSLKKTVKAKINVQIITNGLVEEFPVAVSIKQKSPAFEDFSLNIKLLKQPQVFVVLKKKEVKVTETTKDEIILNGEVVLEILSQEMLPISFPTAIQAASIEEATKKMTIVFEGPISAMGEVDLSVTHKSFLSSLKTLVELKGTYPGKQILLGSVGDKAALSMNLTDAMKGNLKKKNMSLKLLLKSLNLRGEILNEKRPETSKIFEGIAVELQ